MPLELTAYATCVVVSKGTVCSNVSQMDAPMSVSGGWGRMSVQEHHCSVPPSPRASFPFYSMFLLIPSLLDGISLRSIMPVFVVRPTMTWQAKPFLVEETRRSHEDELVITFSSLLSSPYETWILMTERSSTLGGHFF